MAIQYQTYLKVPDEDWFLVNTDYETELVLSSAMLYLLDYYSIIEWRVDTHDDVSGLTTTGDIWTFITQKKDDRRRSDYNPDRVWKPTVGWLNIEDFAYTGGGRLKNRIVAIGHGVVYFGDI